MVGQFESGKDTVQVITESAATHIGNIATIITGAVRGIARETGDWISEVIEMREASQRAQEDEQKLYAAPTVDPVDLVDPVEPVAPAEET
jgi:hypothetical protein